MKNKCITVLSVLFVCSLVFSTNVFASRTTLYLPSNQNWVNTLLTTRTGSSEYTEAQLYAVYPPKGGKDNFRYARVRVLTKSGTVMANEITLDEQSTSRQKVYIRSGYLSHREIRFQFRGNHPDYDANADVEYWGR